MSTHHVMLDLETLGTKPGCPVIAIGAAVIAPLQNYTFKDFYFDVTVNIAQARMDEPDPDTIAWWDKQEQEARDQVFNNPNSIYLSEALNKFNSFLLQLKTVPEDRIIVWGKGATFDEPILVEAMKRYELTPVWTFRDSMCFRTLAELGKMLNIPEPEFLGVRHRALDDAIHQANWARLIMETVGIQA